MTTCVECLTAPFRLTGLVLWPMLSMILGIVGGVVLSSAVTFTIFLITLVRTPIHIAKMMFVTAKTSECFKGKYSCFTRVSVFPLVPVVHILFLLGITVFSGTIGTMYYIGKAAKMFYRQEYGKSMKRIQSSARLEPRSRLGKYVKACQEYMKDDSASHDTILCLKGCVALIPGTIPASLAMVPFSLTVLVITLYRLPINVYKTVKIALFTVALQWDLRLIVLTMLPLIHILFPLITFLVAIIGSFFWTWAVVTVNIFEDKNPFGGLECLGETLKDYYADHKEFADQFCSRYDHPSGIPNGWDGRSYGIEVERLLRWQRDFVVICILIVLGAPVCLAGTCLISAVKFIAGCLHWWQGYMLLFCGMEHSYVKILGAWPLHVLVMLLVPVGAVLFHSFAILFACLSLPFYVGEAYLWEGRGGRGACKAPFEIIVKHDGITGVLCGENWEILEDWEILEGWEIPEGWRCLRGCPTRGHEEERQSQRGRPEQQQEDDRSSALSYWDRFISQGIHTTASLLEGEWLVLDDIQAMDTTVVQSVPAVAILTILIDSVKEKDLKRGDIKWAIDGTVCKASDRPVTDEVTNHLWPMVASIKTILHCKQDILLTNENVQVLKAMLCANNDSETEQIKKVLSGADQSKRALNNEIWTRINNLVFAILQVKPYQERMRQIYTHEYHQLMADIEKGSTQRGESSPPESDEEDDEAGSKTADEEVSHRNRLSDNDSSSFGVPVAVSEANAGIKKGSTQRDRSSSQESEEEDEACCQGQLSDEEDDEAGPNTADQELSHQNRSSDNDSSSLAVPVAVSESNTGIQNGSAKRDRPSSPKSKQDNEACH